MEIDMTYDPRLDSHPALRSCMTYWIGNTWGCYLVRLFAAAAGQTVVVLTELPENTGASVTNVIEQLMHELSMVLSLPADVVWVEHYTDRRQGGDDASLAESFALVELVNGEPAWTQMDREDLFWMLEGK
ncbi:MAG: hypothetical protein KF821_09100 [Anaerolineales bacterium]|nr:hypothetical protein [Anaerolineales bacterium]